MMRTKGFAQIVKKVNLWSKQNKYKLKKTFNFRCKKFILSAGFFEKDLNQLENFFEYDEVNEWWVEEW